MKIRWLTACLVLATIAGLAACAPASTPVPPTTTASTPSAASGPTAASSSGLTQVSVAMGYIPNIQFAPWFVADKKGYFASAGLQVKFVWGFEVDGIKMLGANQADFALLGGDQVIQARSQDIPLVYVANYYSSFPITIFSLKEKNIVKPQDLVGKKVGLPAYFGATYTGWRALLYAAGIKESDIKTQDVGFNQIAAVTQGTVDAAAGYTNNEPVQLRLQGKDLNEINVGDYSKLIGIGLVTNEKTVAERPQIVQKMVAALVHAMQDTINNPSEALDISLQSLPEAGGSNLNSTKAVLDATIALWKSPHLGYNDPAGWDYSAKFMKDAGFIKTDIDVSKAYTNKFVP